MATATSSLNFLGSNRRVGVPSGSSSLLLWCLVLNWLLCRLNVYTRLVVLISEKFPATMQRTLNLIQNWCSGNILTVNLAFFTNRKILNAFRAPSLFNVTLPQPRSVQYLGVILDNKLRAIYSYWVARKPLASHGIQN